MVKDAWFRWRHRKSRSEVIAFALGLKTGMILGGITPEAIDKIEKQLLEDYGG